MNNPQYLCQKSIQKFLNRCIDRLNDKAADERKNRIVEKIVATNFPELFDPQEPSVDEILWHDVQHMIHDGIVELERTKNRLVPDIPPWEYARLIFNSEKELVVRQWLNRPQMSDYERDWHQAVAHHRDSFADISQLAKPLFSELGRPAAQVVERLVQVPQRLKSHPLTAYQLSAELFWGNSKLLKDKVEKLTALFQLLPGQLLERPIVLDVTYPQGPPRGVLLIENLDSYVAAAEGLWPQCEDLILVYTQGFKGAALRIRNTQVARFHVNSSRIPSQQVVDEFEACWFGIRDFHYPVFMITDLDREGMLIFRAAKESFPLLEAWQPGYLQMLQAHTLGNCHSPAEADKSLQRTLESSGSLWLDEHVVHILDTNCFVDQEIIGG